MKKKLKSICATISKYFTKRGYESYSEAQEKSNFFEGYKNHNWDITVYHKEKDPIVENTIFKDGNAWIVDVPIFLHANRRDGYIRKRDFYVKLVIERKEDDADSLGIAQYIMTDSYRYTSPRCWKHQKRAHEVVSKKLYEMGLIKQTIFVKQAEKDTSKVLELMSEDMKKEAEYCREEQMKQNPSHSENESNRK